tara:strand:- start:1138 stop:2247 length:1110 start_codon:yes stop_codon:yes gene_type:complete
MCGIFGLAKAQGELTEKQKKILKKSLSRIAEKASVRGEDSTGLAITNSNGTKTYKSLLSSRKIIHTKDWLEILDTINEDTISVIGHTRYATRGAVSIRNSHPFTYDPIVGAHNGCIYNWDSIDGYQKDMEVDSEIIFSRLSQGDYQKALKSLNGYFALSWLNKQDPKRLYLTRDEAPTYVAYWKATKTLFWASTKEILSYGLDKGGLRLKLMKLPSHKIYQYHTEGFDNAPVFETKKLKRDSFAKGYSTRFKYNGYNYSYSSSNVWCDYCGTYKSKNNNNWCDTCGISYQLECDLCLKSTQLSLLNYDSTGDYYFCSDCESEINDNNLNCCDYCGDPTSGSDIVVSSAGTKICKYCIMYDSKGNNQWLM